MKRLIFKIKGIPIATETFIISNIVHAIKKGFNVQVITDILYPIETSSQESLMKEMGIPDLILKYQSPTNKKTRVRESILFLLNPIMFYFFCRLNLRLGRVSLEHIYYLKFYKRYKEEDVFHVHFGIAVSPLLVLKSIGFLKSKVIVTFHGYDAYALPEGNERTLLIDQYGKYVSAITVNSQFLGKHLVSQGFDENMIHVIPVGINCANFVSSNSLRKRSDVFELLSVGRLIPLKGHRFGIEVIRNLVSRGHNVHYTIAGYGASMEPLQDLITKYELEDNIVLVGKQSQEQVIELLKGSDVFLMTSTYNSSNRREAFGVVSLEAQVSGVPVVGFDSGGFPETVIKDVTGFIVDDRDVEAMTLAVEKLMLNSDLHESMSKSAKQHVLNTYDINSVAEEYFKLYQ
jgi:colanic acid/amylovoran biosynthesis glycosyltransferase